MPRRVKGSPPSYRLHKQSGQAIVSLPLGGGAYRDVLLGPHGSPESHAEYSRVIAEWQANGGHYGTAGDTAPSSALSVNELVLRFWPHVERHYRDQDGVPTREVEEYRVTLRMLRKFYGHTEAAGFGPLSLRALREKMIAAGWCRNVVNARVGRVKRMFKWAVGYELVSAATLQALQAVPGLQAGRSEARETEPVAPVADAVVDATLPFLSPTLRAMVRVGRLTGMRPGEVCRLRACEIDMTGRVWLYRPSRHKTAWRGKKRVVPIGPQAQEVIKPYLKLDIRAYLFSPADAKEEEFRERRARRKTPVQPSQRNRRKAAPRRRPGERYARSSYDHAIRLACDRAFPPPAHLARRRVAGKRKDGRLETVAEWRERLGPEGWAEVEAWRASHRWSPNQLRHSFLTEVRRGYGLEAAQVIAGHAQANTTELYAERDMGLAERVAAEIG